MIKEDLDLEDFNDDTDINADFSKEDKNNKHEHDHENNSHKDHIKIMDIKDITEEEKSKNKLKDLKVDDKIEAGGKKSDDAKIEADKNIKSKSNVDEMEK